MRLALLLVAVIAACGPDDPFEHDAGSLDADVDALVGDGGLVRSSTDRPDDVTGYQVHVMYVVPADGVDRQLDVDGSIARSVAAWNKWLGDRANGTNLRLDTVGGALDITFARLPSTDAQIVAEVAEIRTRIEAELMQLGRLAPQKLYAVYYDGGSTYSCGGGAWPPGLVGSVGAIYLKGTPPGVPCGANMVGISATVPAYFEYAILHELFHSLGAASACMPHYTAAYPAHVGDRADDLMYSGTQVWRPMHLDVDHDDYWGHGRNDCLDLARSAFLTPLPANAQKPPGWP